MNFIRCRPGTAVRSQEFAPLDRGWSKAASCSKRRQKLTRIVTRRRLFVGMHVSSPRHRIRAAPAGARERDSLHIVRGACHAILALSF